MENVHLCEEMHHFHFFSYASLPGIQDKTEQNIAPIFNSLMTAS